MMKSFDFNEYGYSVREAALKCAITLLKHPVVYPYETGIMAKAYLALMGSDASDGFACVFGVKYSKKTNEVTEDRYIIFYFSDDEVRILQGFGDFEKKAIDLLDRGIDIGNRDENLNIEHLEEEFRFLLSNGAEPIVMDFSQKPCHEEDDTEERLCDYKDSIIRIVADNTYKRVKTKVIRTLCGMKNCLLSGDDSGLINTWDEICAQVQGEESFSWDAYVDVINALIKEEVEKLDDYKKQALWFQTDYFYSDFTNNSEGQLDIKTILDYIYDGVMGAASDWTNKRIEKYLETEFH